jgi:hypothetical protein
MTLDTGTGTHRVDQTRSAWAARAKRGAGRLKQIPNGSLDGETVYRRHNARSCRSHAGALHQVSDPDKMTYES